MAVWRAQGNHLTPIAAEVKNKWSCTFTASVGLTGMHRSIMIRYYRVLTVIVVLKVLHMSYDVMFYLILKCSRVCVCVCSFRIVCLVMFCGGSSLIQEIAPFFIVLQELH